MSKEASPLGPVAPAAGSVLPDVAAIVVNYGTAELALQAVESLLARPERLAMVHLVDNASPGGDGAVLARAIADRGWEGRVTLHAERVNHGFGRGNNLVIETLLARGGADKVFLLNPDARILDGGLAQLAEVLDAHPEVGAVGARISRPEAGKIVPVTAAFRFPSLISIFSDAVSFGPLARLCAPWRVALAPDLGSGPVDWVAGAAVMFRLKALGEVGGFDPAFFLYFEEVELMHRMKRAGWEIWYQAEALAEHAEGVSTGVKSGTARRRPAYWYHSWQWYMRKTHGRAYALGAAALWLSGATLNHLISALRRRAPAAPPGFFADFARHALWPLVRG